MPRSSISWTSFSSWSRTAAPGLGQGPTGQQPEGLQVLVSRAQHDLVGERRDGRLLVPVDLLEVIADELLVEARLRLPRHVLRPGPEARRIRRQRLVDQDEVLGS